MKSNSIYIIMILSLFFGCKSFDRNQIKIAKTMSDALLDSIATGNAESQFPIKYFNPAQTNIILGELKNNCDFSQRKGHFINDFYLNQNGINRVAFIYEFYLKCDSLRFILTYNLSPNIELYELKMESIKKNNFMITKPERRLKF